MNNFLLEIVESIDTDVSHDVDFNFLQEHAYKGNMYAQYNLGVMYLKGNGVPQDYKEACKLLKMAAMQDLVEAFNLLQMSAKQGLVEAQYNLGLMYQYGEGVSQSYKDAINWYRKAAKQEYAEAQYSLGVMYGRGVGVNRDIKKARSFLRKACDNGHRGACAYYISLEGIYL